MTYTIHKKAEVLLNEPCFKLFKHMGLYCCIQRVMHSGHLVGYVAVPEDHYLYGKSYDSQMVIENTDNLKFNNNYTALFINALQEKPSNIISLDLVLNAHGGITYSEGHLNGIEDDLLGKLWWFGFDTAHLDDLRPFQNDIDRKYAGNHEKDEYRDFGYVESQIKQLAEQLIGI